MEYVTVIGLEIHAELLTKSKVYCSCRNEFGGGENTRVCPVCSGMPGTLPAINRGAVELAVKAGFALNCRVNNYSAFDRKNYFYPDLPKAYQITQLDYPICENGYLDIGSKRIRINNIHLEEDAGKLSHDSDSVSVADYNRCGVPLIEIVTEPDFESVEEVKQFVNEVALSLKYAGVCDARMEQGSLRVDVNISLKPIGAVALGTRAEIKNLNSLRAIGRAVEYEIKRQAGILNSGGKVVQETRRFNDKDGTTSSLRTKEEAQDYRYFPEPDIPPVFITDEELRDIRRSMPSLPKERFYRYTGEYKLSDEDAWLILNEKEFSDFYDEAVYAYNGYRTVSNIMLGEFLRRLNMSETDILNVRFTPKDLAELARMSDEGKISKNAAKEILAIMFENGGTPKQIANEQGFLIEDNIDELKGIIESVIAKRSDLAEDYRNGNSKVFGFLMGLVMKNAGRGTDPRLAKDLLEEILK